MKIQWLLPLIRRNTNKITSYPAQIFDTNITIIKLAINIYIYKSTKTFYRLDKVQCFKSMSNVFTTFVFVLFAQYLFQMMTGNFYFACLLKASLYRS